VHGHFWPDELLKEDSQDSPYEDFQGKLEADMKIFWNCSQNMDCSGDITVLSFPSDGKFDYPVGKRQTQEHSDMLRKAEQHFDLFWKAIDAELERNSSMTPRLQKVLSQRVLYRTTLSSDPDKQPIKQSGADVFNKDELSRIQFHLEYSTEKTIAEKENIALRVKHKTRGVGQLSNFTSDLQSALPLSAEETTDPIRLALDRRSLKVLGTLFFTASATYQPGEIPWVNFLHTMWTVGFEAEKLHGSA
jgi:hypothetical protein